MYNLIVIGYENESWLENGSVKIAANRFLEYTDTPTVERFKNNIEHTYRYPCLIAKEGDDPDMYIGQISKAAFDGQYYHVEFNLVDECHFRFSDIGQFVLDFDIRDWEMARTHWAVKEGDLYHLLMIIRSSFTKKEGTLLEAFFKSLPQVIEIEGPITSSVGSLNVDMTYVGEDKEIKGVTEFIKKIVHPKNIEGRINFYRGHSNSIYKLEPSLFRKTKNGSFQYLENEDTIYNELLTQNFGEFGNDNSTFDRLVRMQHFSLPTRLLDVSTNPLIALYFACRGNEGLSGEVVSIQVPKTKVKYFDSDTATCIANLCKLTIKDKESLSVGELDANYETAQKKLYHCIKDDKPYFREAIEDGSINEVLCIKGKITNSRINAQSGAFLLFGLDAVLEDTNNFGFEITRYVIEADTKKKIILELDLLNINESTLFPYLENSAKYISNKFQKT